MHAKLYLIELTSISISDKISVKREARQHDMLISQITADNLKRTFQVYRISIAIATYLSENVHAKLAI